MKDCWNASLLVGTCAFTLKNITETGPDYRRISTQIGIIRLPGYAHCDIIYMYLKYVLALFISTKNATGIVIPVHTALLYKITGPV